METQTLAEMKAATATKLALTSKGYKATVKGMTPDAAIDKVVHAHTQMLALRERKEAPTEENRADRPAVLILDMTTGLYTLKHGGGEVAPFDPSTDLSEEYAIKIDLEMNSKGIGWDVVVRAASVEAGVAMIEYTEAELTRLFDTPTP